MNINFEALTNTGAATPELILTRDSMRPHFVRSDASNIDLTPSTSVPTEYPKANIVDAGSLEGALVLSTFAIVTAAVTWASVRRRNNTSS